MKIIKDPRISNKWHKGFLRDQTFNRKGEIVKTKFELPYVITLHGTGGGDNCEGVIQWILNGGKLQNGKNRKGQYKRGIGIFPFLIGRSGKIFQLLDPNRWTFHSSSFTYDRFTIAIELLNPHPNNEDPYTLAQYESLFWLMFEHLFVEYPINVITSHERLAQKYSGKKKNCPGNFDWDKLESELKKRKYKFDNNSLYNSYWGIR